MKIHCNIYNEKKYLTLKVFLKDQIPQFDVLRKWHFSILLQILESLFCCCYPLLKQRARLSALRVRVAAEFIVAAFFFF